MANLKILGAVAVVALSFGPPANAETLPKGDIAALDTVIGAYIYQSPWIHRQLLGFAETHYELVGNPCTEPGYLEAIDVAWAFESVVMEPGDDHPSEGVWVYRYTVKKCGNSKKFQALGVAAEEQALGIAVACATSCRFRGPQASLLKRASRQCDAPR